ncbi:MAG: alpha/beta hydrolase [Phycisphaerales bacterium]|nr:MAG: alpha/beta hydrolase [Phycisphaerales bacterium]
MVSESRSPLDRFVTLPDGRSLAYREHGDPHGVPVFVFHGIPGSRIQRHPDDEIARSLGARVITVDRPGCGLSDPMPGRRIADWPADVAFLADAIGAARFRVIGWSGGGPYVAAVAHALPERVERAMLVSSLAPIDAPGATEGMIRLFRLGFALAYAAPWVLDASLPLWMRRLERDPERIVRHIVARATPEDRALLADPALRTLFGQTLLDGGRQGRRGPSYELRLVARPWGVPLEEIRVPTIVWHGALDRTAPIGMGRWLAGTIPGATGRWFPRDSHFLAFTRWREVLGAVLE